MELPFAAGAREPEVDFVLEGDGDAALAAVTSNPGVSVVAVLLLDGILDGEVGGAEEFAVLGRFAPLGPDVDGVGLPFAVGVVGEAGSRNFGSSP
jgi:hypothetical protein